MEMLEAVAKAIRQGRREAPKLILIRLAGLSDRPESIEAPNDLYALRMKGLLLLAEIKRRAPVMFA